MVDFAAAIGLLTALLGAFLAFVTINQPFSSAAPAVLWCGGWVLMALASATRRISKELQQINARPPG